MYGLHITLIGVCSGRNAYVLAAAQGRRKPSALASGIVTTDEFHAVIGLPDQIAQRDATALQMRLDASGEDGTGGCAAALGKRPEQQPTAHFARGVLNDG